jgi:hypothetical protein
LAVTLQRKTEHVAGTENNTTHLIINPIKNSTVIPHIIIQIPKDLLDLTACILVILFLLFLLLLLLFLLYVIIV